MPTAAIALGSNLGDRHAAIAAGFRGLGSLFATTVLAVSDIIETAPVGPVPQGPYLNAACKVETALPPCALLDHLLALEKLQGRDRSTEQRWGPRTLDLDLILYDGLTIDEPGLQVPHPRLHERAFVLQPLAQIWPDAVVPGLNKAVAQLLQDLRVPSAR